MLPVTMPLRLRHRRILDGLTPGPSHVASSGWILWDVRIPASCLLREEFLQRFLTAVPMFLRLVFIKMSLFS